MNSSHGQSASKDEPIDAATLIIVDQGASSTKVLLGKRHLNHVFMPGRFVFPGGRVEPYDRSMPAFAALHPDIETQLLQYVDGFSADDARALALAAIRETFEETGLLLGTARPDAPPAPAGPWMEFIKTGLYPNLAVLSFIARAITPAGFPRRFDARFFCADLSAVTHRIEHVTHAEAELVELKWVSISDARRLDLPAITQVVLGELEERLAAGLKHDLPAPFYRMQDGRFTRELIWS